MSPICNCVLHNHTAHGGLCFAFVGFMAVAGTKEKPTKPNPEKPQQGKTKKKKKNYRRQSVEEIR